VFGRDERVVGENQLAVLSDDVLLGLEMKGKPVHSLAANQNEFGLGRILHVAEEHRACIENLDRHRIAASAAELVAGGHGGRTRFAHVVASLLHELLLGESGVWAFY